MEVTGWTYWEDNRYTDLPDEMYFEAREVVVSELCKRGYKFTGGYHQDGVFGVPIIDGKWKFGVSQRSWGQVMVDAYPCEIDDEDDMGYVMWAWMAPEPMVIPKESEYEQNRSD